MADDGGGPGRDACASTIGRGWGGTPTVHLSILTADTVFPTSVEQSGRPYREVVWNTLAPDNPMTEGQPAVLKRGRGMICFGWRAGQTVSFLPG